MTDQRTDAAERSAHVTRGDAAREIISPCVEIRPGVWQLRAIVERDAEIARLRGAAVTDAMVRAAVEAPKIPFRERPATMEDWIVANMRIAIAAALGARAHG